MISFPRYGVDGKRHLEVFGTHWRWWVKQLLPLTYWGEHYPVQPDGSQGQRVVTIWRMWFGRSFDVLKFNA